MAAPSTQTSSLFDHAAGFFQTDEMYRFSSFLILVATCLSPALGQSQIQISADKLDAIFADFVEPGSPGCALGISERQRLIFVGGYGQANLEHRVPIRRDTVFRIGSTSKQFTAAAIQLLAQDGLLSLEDDLHKFLPELQDYGHAVRIRHLIHHTSGLRDYLTLMSLAGLRHADFYTDEQVLAILARQRELNFKPGDQFLYSNSGYFLLAEIVKRVSGKDLRQFAQERILNPLGMKSSHFHNNHEEIVLRRASGYRRTPKGFEISMTTLEMIGDGGLFTTVEDLNRWQASFYTGQLGGQKLLQEMERTAQLNDGQSIDYASGLRVSNYRGLRTVRHGGAFVGFRAELLRFPEQGVAITCLCNLAQTNPSRLANRVADVILEDSFTQAKTPRGGETGPSRPPVRASQAAPRAATRKAEQSRYQGIYRSHELDIQVEVLSGESGLLIRNQDLFRDSPEDEFLPTTQGRFSAGVTRLDFEVSGSVVTGFRLSSGRVRNLLFLRLGERRQ